MYFQVYYISVLVRDIAPKQRHNVTEHRTGGACDQHERRGQTRSWRLASLLSDARQQVNASDQASCRVGVQVFNSSAGLDLQIFAEPLELEIWGHK
jgi:hypothetical protein